DPVEAPLVRKAFMMRADGYSWAAIARELNATGVTPRQWKRDGIVRAAQWSGQAARRLVVGREVYVGVAYSGEHRHEDAHKALVTRGLYDRATRTLGSKGRRRNGAGSPDNGGRRPGHAANGGQGHLLNGLARCAACGRVLVVNVHSSSGIAYYRCPGRR